MALERDFLSMTQDRITVHSPSTALSFYGAATPASTSTGKSYAAHVDMTPRKVVSSRGTEEVAAGTIYVFSSSADIGLHHVIELADGRKPEILKSEPMRDDEGQHHVEVTFR